MVRNEVKRANDDDHGEFGGTTATACGEKEREKERWFPDAMVRVKTEANSPQNYEVKASSRKCIMKQIPAKYLS